MDMRAWSQCLSQGQWFSRVPAPFQDSLLTRARVRRLAPGQRLFQRGDPPCGLYAVLEGAVRVGGVSEEGKEALLALVEAPQWFGEIGVFDGRPRTHDAYGVGHCILLHMPQATLHALLEEQPQHWRALALLMSQKLRLTFISLEQRSLMPAAARVAHRLLLIAEGYGQTEPPLRALQLPQEQLALMLSLSRQTTNQLLNDLQSQGIVRLNYGAIEVLDLARLRAAASPAV